MVTKIETPVTLAEWGSHRSRIKTFGDVKYQLGLELLILVFADTPYCGVSTLVRALGGVLGVSPLSYTSSLLYAENEALDLRSPNRKEAERLFYNLDNGGAEALEKLERSIRTVGINFMIANYLHSANQSRDIYFRELASQESRFDRVNQAPPIPAVMAMRTESPFARKRLFENLGLTKLGEGQKAEFRRDFLAIRHLTPSWNTLEERWKMDCDKSNGNPKVATLKDLRKFYDRAKRKEAEFRKMYGPESKKPWYQGCRFAIPEKTPEAFQAEAVRVLKVAGLGYFA